MYKSARGIAMGVIVGAAVGAMMMPNLDRRTQKSMRRAAKRVKNMGEDTYDRMIDWIG